MTRRAVVTLHDVTPATLDDCLAALALLRRRGVDPVTLLVVPGAGWSGPDLDTLRDLAAEGYPLAAHGWSHRAPIPGSTYHTLHSALISRDEAEHLSRSNAELKERVTRSARWFVRVGLDTPAFYVPPAWAMGRLSGSDLAVLPFRFYETLTGIRDIGTGRFRRLPLVGYLADTPVRVWALRVSNALNLIGAAILRRPLRVAIHPPDLQLPLADELLRLLDRGWRFLTVEEAMGITAHAVHHAVS